MKQRDISLIAHITIIGWVIALVMYQNNKSNFITFYLRQTLGIYALFFVIQIIVKIMGGFSILNVLPLVLLIMSAISAYNDKQDETPIIGDKFQEWFSFIN